MLDDVGTVIYVGKAKNLKKRVSSYFQRQLQLDIKTQQLVKQIHSIEITLTRNEREALLLESNLIKELQPKFNVIFRDDKSYPYLRLSVQDPFPRLSLHRGERRDKSKYYGPYPSARLAREALSFLQRIFKLRQCDNGFFKSRVRPCLQYQIKRCTAPCVGYIEETSYRQDVQNAVLFLEGKSQAVIQQLMTEMDAASQNQTYEQAAKLRDQIALLRSIQEQQIIFGKNLDIDVLGIAVSGRRFCIHVLVIRQGSMRGARHYFPQPTAVLHGLQEQEIASALLETFILQHYLQHADKKDLPKTILVGHDLKERQTIVSILEEGLQISVAKRGKRLQWLAMANESAVAALRGQVNGEQRWMSKFEALQSALNLEAIPNRLACFDISHTQGDATVASCVVFEVNGPLKSAYRRFSIRSATPGDDYGAMREALTRQFTRLKTEGQILPDIVFIDGGKGQLSVAETVLQELQVAGVVLLGVAKGAGRKPGLETLYLTSLGSRLELSQDSEALHLIQAIRDEAHRFAITAHRSKRGKKSLHSRLEDIPGIGKQRRIALLKQFGGLQEVMKASVEELGKVPGVSLALAKRIYSALHGE